MFLREILTHRPEGKSRFAEGIRACEAAGQPVAGIWRLFAWRPALADPLCRLTQEVMRGPSSLPAGLRELIGAFTSARNRCLF